MLRQKLREITIVQEKVLAIQENIVASILQKIGFVQI